MSDHRIDRTGRFLYDASCPTCRRMQETMPGFYTQDDAAKAPQKIDTGVFPFSSTKRKNIPLVRGLLDYFPAALAAVAEVSRIGNEQHNPGQEMHWARGKSTDHADCIVRHLADRGRKDTDGVSHTAKVAWRALALLQEELEAEGAAPGRASRFPDKT